jgi:hypothetical protein
MWEAIGIGQPHGEFLFREVSPTFSCLDVLVTKSISGGTEFAGRLSLPQGPGGVRRSQSRTRILWGEPAPRTGRDLALEEQISAG